MSNKKPHTQLRVVITFCVPFNCKPQKSTDKST